MQDWPWDTGDKSIDVWIEEDIVEAYQTTSYLLVFNDIMTFDFTWIYNVLERVFYSFGERAWHNLWQFVEVHPIPNVDLYEGFLVIFYVPSDEYSKMAFKSVFVHSNVIGPINLGVFVEEVLNVMWADTRPNVRWPMVGMRYHDLMRDK